MKNAVVTQETKPIISAAIEKVLIEGNLAALSPQERVSYYNSVCETVGLNPLTRPFDYLVLNGKLILYANKSCAEQLRQIHKVSICVTTREKIGEVYVVTAKAKLPDGREDESTGAVSLGSFKGDALANLYMKAETKAKRRATLSICGLSMLDESEVESIDRAKRVSEAELDKLPADKPPGAQLKTVTPEYRPGFGPYKGKTFEEALVIFGEKLMREHYEASKQKQTSIKNPKAEAVDYVERLGEFLANAGAIDVTEGDNVPF